MEPPADGSEVKLDIKLSWAIYGGHISGRRQLGVKVNPLFQENDSSTTRGDSSNQPGTSTSTSEIEINTYESLPRLSFVRSSISVPNISQAHDTGLSRLPYVYNGHIAYLGDVEVHDEARNFSNFSLPRSQAGAEAQVDEHDTVERSESVDSDKSRDHVRPWSWPHSDRGYRKQLPRQIGIDATADEPDEPEVVELTEPLTSGSSSTSSLTLFENNPFYQMKRRIIPRILTPTSFLRKKELSVLQEQSSLVDNEQPEEFSDTDSLTIIADVYVDTASTAANGAMDGASIVRVSCDVETRTLETSEEICHTLSFTHINEQIENKLYSANNGDTSFINKTLINNSYPLFESDTLKELAT